MHISTDPLTLSLLGPQLSPLSDWTHPALDQVKYVVELAKSLACIPSVARVDLLTRLITDPKVADSYGVLEERMQVGGAR